MKRKLVTFLLVLLTVAGGAVSIAAQDSNEDTLTILMASPGEGESFYAAYNGFVLSIPIAGQVVSYDSHLDFETVEVTLDFVDAEDGHLHMTTTVDDTGFFEVWMAIQPLDRSFVSDDMHDIEDCAICHRQTVEVMMPDQPTQVVVEARAADGRTGRTVRHFHLERSSYKDIVVDIEGLPDNAAGGQISASTLIFEWRRRTFYGGVGNGQAVVSVEGLPHANLVYDVALAPFVFDGVQYTAAPQTVTVYGGADGPSNVTLHAEAAQVRIAGIVNYVVSGDEAEATLLAVDPLSGASYTTNSTFDGTFVFENLPVADYVLFARVPDGFHFPQRVNLTESLNVETRIQLTRSGADVLRGVVTLDGEPLPFAQINVVDLPMAYADPVTGAFEIDAVAAEGDIPVEITAAGCYGVQLSASERNIGEIALTLHDDTRVIERGGARLYIPAETGFTEVNDIIRLNHGVLWVQAGDGTTEAPLQIRVKDYMLQGDAASFAVENAANVPARLYVSAGQVRVSGSDGDEPVYVMMDQTLVLEESPGSPADLNPGAGSVLRSMAGSVAHYEEAPSTSERLSTVAYQSLVLVAKTIMVLAYVISAAVPILFGVGVIILLRRQRSANPKPAA